MVVSAVRARLLDHGGVRLRLFATLLLGGETWAAGHVVRVVLRYPHFSDYEIACGFLDRAKAASPSSSMAWALSSATHSYVGRPDFAVTEAERALRLSPLDPQAFFLMMIAGIAHYASGQFEEAVKWGYRSFGQHPQTTGNLRTLAASLVALNRRSEAQEVAATLLKHDPRFNLTEYSRQCPWSGTEVRRLFIERLRLAGLPE